MSEPSPALRRRLAELWSQDALLEHASIASFARFSLQLLAVAAPPRLLEAAHRAALDEVEHAKLCFRLASKYGGTPVAPGPLPLEGDVIGSTDLASIAAATATEGCIGETIGAVEARAALDAAEPEDVRSALERIAGDESNHAELAWEFVRWALDQGDEQVRSAVRGAFRAAIHRPPSSEPRADPDAEALASHGRLDARTLHHVRRRALTEVVKPAAETLLGESL
jgi:hypothetical protein